MNNDQMHLPHGGEDIIQQVEAYKMAGISRAMLRGCIDRGELRIADHHGSRGSARLYRSDVLRLMTEKGWPGASAAAVPPQQQPAGEGCRGCSALKAEQQRDRETMRRLRDALSAATA